MSWQAIAKKDIQDSVRSRTLWGIIILFLGLVTLMTWLTVDTSEESLDVAAGFTFFFGILFFVPLAGLLISVKSIVRERESGTIALLLSLPHTRAEMVLGKFLGRTTVMTVAVLIGFLPTLLYTAMSVDEFGGFEMITFLLAISLFGMMFVGIGVGFSALVNTETQATFGTVVIFFLLFLWPFIIDNLGLDVPTFLMRFWLVFMFLDIWFTLLALREGSITAASVVEFENFVLDPILESSPDIHMQLWFVFVILALWIIVPVAIGAFRFLKMDL